MVSGVADPIAPADVVTVAELLHRYAPDPTTGPLTVGSLLRREGHEPSADRTGDRDGAPRGPGAVVRRGAIAAAGTLVVAGSVLGAAVLGDTGVTGAAGGTGTPGGYPGEGRLDLPQAGVGAIPTVVDNTAQSDPLDAGDAAPRTWTDIAFPSGVTAPPTAPAVGGVPTVPATGTGTGTGTAGGGTGTAASGTTGGSTAGGGAPGPAAEAPQRSGLGGAVAGVGEAAGGPVGGVVEDLGGAVGGVGDTLGGGSPSLVGELARGLL